jgi:prolipoprotein diacylglyceryltransferase
VDKASGIYSIFYGLGCIIAIIVGNILVLYISTDETKKYPLSCDVMAIISILFGFVFFIANRVYKPLCSKPTKDEDPIFKVLVEKMKHPDEFQPLFGLAID